MKHQKIIILAALGLFLGSEGYSSTVKKKEIVNETRIKKPITKDKNISLWGSAAPLCMCISMNVGYWVDKSNIVGINYYTGGIPFVGGGTQKGIFVRSFPMENSFFVNGRLGYLSTFMHKSYDSDEKKGRVKPLNESNGPSLQLFSKSSDDIATEESKKSELSIGIDLGNQWHFDNGASVGVTWVGIDKFVDSKSSTLAIPHGLRLELGYNF